MTNEHDQSLRKHLTTLLQLKGAHASAEDVLADWPPDKRGVVPRDLPYSGWQFLEHLRIAQWDILEFSRDPNHVSPNHPEGYWPTDPEPPSKTAWDESLQEFRSGSQEMQRLVNDPDIDLFAKIPHGSGQTILREALLVADHNSYHLGELVVLRRLLNIWPSS